MIVADFLLILSSEPTKQRVLSDTAQHEASQLTGKMISG